MEFLDALAQFQLRRLVDVSNASGAACAAASHSKVDPRKTRLALGFALGRAHLSQAWASLPKGHLCMEPRHAPGSGSFGAKMSGWALSRAQRRGRADSSHLLKTRADEGDAFFNSPSPNRRNGCLTSILEARFWDYDHLSFRSAWDDWLVLSPPSAVWKASLFRNVVHGVENQSFCPHGARRTLQW